MDRDRSIIGQNAGTTAAALLTTAIQAGVVAPATIDELLESFDTIRTSVFNGSLALAGAQAVVETFESSPAESSSGSRPLQSVPTGGGRPHADVEMKVGKYRGKTIGYVYDLGEDGASYLDWASKNLSNEWLKSRIVEFLNAA